MRALIESVQYNIYHILPKPPLDLEIFQIQGKKEVSETVDNAINFRGEPNLPRSEKVFKIY